jgi:iron complex outermembrane receptor protein
MNHRHLVVSAVTSMTSLFATNVFAQKGAASPSSAASSGLEEVVVTAERREINVQDVPLAVSVLSSEQLDARGVSDVRDLQKLQAGLQVVEVGQQPGIFIRGVGSVVANVSQDAAATFNIDNVSVARPLAMNAAMFDLERVEVVKGPQGTLYGRNATAGAVNVLTRWPTHEYEGSAAVRIGNFNLRQAELIGNLPLTERFALRLGAQSVERDGHLWNGSNDADSKTGRIRALWELTADLNILASATYSHLGGLGPGDVPLKNAGSYLYPNDPWRLDTNAGVPNGTLQDGLFGNSVPNFGQTQSIDSQNYTVEVNWDFGPVALTVIPAFLKTSYDTLAYIGGFRQVLDSDDEQRSVEARLASSGESKLQWIAGFYYMKDEQESFNLNHTTVNGLLSTSTPFLDLETWAGFGQVTYSLSDRLRFTVGGRYTEDHKTTLSIIQSMTLAEVPVGPSLPGPGDKIWNYVSYRAGFDFDLSADSLLYVNVSDAYKAGGINTGAPSGPAGSSAWDPEHLTSYQIGSRNDFLDGRLRLNAEAWYWKWDDLQLFGIGCSNAVGGLGGGPVACPAGTVPTGATRNAGKATNYGIETESIWHASDNDDFSLNLSYVVGRYDRGFLFPFVLDGQELARTPKWTGVASYRRTWRLSGGARIAATLTDQFQSHSLSVVQRIEGQRESGWHSPSADLSFTSPSGRWVLALWGENLNNDEHTVFAGQTFAGVWGHPTAPRTYGVRIRADF